MCMDINPPKKNVHNFLLIIRLYATSELSMLAWNWNATDSKKNYFWPDFPPIFPDMTVQRNVPQFCTGQDVTETCFSHWDYLSKYTERLR